MNTFGPFAVRSPSHDLRFHALRTLLVVGSVLAVSLPPLAAAQTATICGPEVNQHDQSGSNVAVCGDCQCQREPADGPSDGRSDAASSIDSVVGAHANRLQLHADLGKCAELPHPSRSVSLSRGSHQIGPPASRA